MGRLADRFLDWWAARKVWQLALIGVGSMVLLGSLGPLAWGPVVGACIAPPAFRLYEWGRSVWRDLTGHDDDDRDLDWERRTRDREADTAPEPEQSLAGIAVGVGRSEVTGPHRPARNAGGRADLSYAATLSDGSVELLDPARVVASAQTLLRAKGGDAVGVERITSDWVGSLYADGSRSWSRITQPLNRAGAETRWQVILWQQRDAERARVWSCPDYPAARDLAAHLAGESPQPAEVRVTRVTCERIGAVLANGAVEGRILTALQQRSAPAKARSGVS